MEITRFGEEMIWQVSLPAGVGSNPIGLDRGQLGDTHVVRFERVGPRVLMVEPNYATAPSRTIPAERRAVEESFAQSVLAGFKVEASDARAACWSTPPSSSSATRTAWRAACATREQGTYTLDRNRSALYLPRTKAFPKNTEVEATLTFTTGDRPATSSAASTPTAGGRDRARASLVRGAAGARLSSRASRIRASASSASSSTTTPRPSPSRSRSAGSRGTGWRRRTRPPRSPIR